MLKHGKSGDTDASRLSQLLTELAKKISNSLGDSAERTTEVPGLMLYRRTAPTVPNPSTYEPSLLVIAQGRIRVDLGKASYVFGRSRFLLTSLEQHDGAACTHRVVLGDPSARSLAYLARSRGIRLLRAHATDGATNTMIRENRDTAPPGALLRSRRGAYGCRSSPPYDVLFHCSVRVVTHSKSPSGGRPRISPRASLHPTPGMHR